MEVVGVAINIVAWTMMAMVLVFVLVIAIAQRVAGETWPIPAAIVLAALGTVPTTVFGVLFYALRADPRWAIAGPPPFGSLGGGPSFLAMATFALTSTTTLWGLSGMLASQVGRAIASRYRSG